MDSPWEGAMFPVGSFPSRRFEPITAPAGDSGGSTVSTLERSFDDLNINPLPPSPPPSPRPTNGIVTRTLMERRQQHWQDERKKEKRQQHWQDEREKEKRQNGRLGPMAPAAAAAVAKRGEHGQRPLWRRRLFGPVGREIGRWQRSSAESRVSTAGIAKRRQTRRELMTAAAAVAAHRLWVGTSSEQGRPVPGPSASRHGVLVGDLLKSCQEQYLALQKFLDADVEGMENEEEKEEEDDGDDDMYEDEEENVGGDQRTREDSVMGDD